MHLPELGQINPLISEEFRENFENFIQNDGSGELELEVRFGYFTSDGFVSHLPSTSMYRSIRAHLDKLCKKHYPRVVKQSTDKIIDVSKGIRRVNQGGNIHFQEKVTVSKYDNPDWGIRFAKCYETIIPEVSHFVPVIRRYCRRTSYFDSRPESAFYGFRIDLTEVLSNDQLNFELEIEAMKGHGSSIQQWWAIIKLLYGWSLDAQEEFQIISYKERAYVANLINFHLKRTLGNTFNPDVVNRPKTLMRIEDTQGKAISIKYDGVHKLVVLNNHGIYACSPSFDIIKIGAGIPIGTTIIEGELMPTENCIYLFDMPICEGESIKSLNFEQRYRAIVGLISNLNDHKLLIKLEMKPCSFTQSNDIIIEYIQSCQADGIIFQSLGSYDDAIYKWKPLDKLTVDFYLDRCDHNCYIPHVIHNGELIPFYNFKVYRGSEDWCNRIVECRWDVRDSIWVPIRDRPDKMYPNSLRVAESTFKMIQQPISYRQIFNQFLST